MSIKQRDVYQVSLKALILNEHNEVLALNAVPTGSFAGYFDLPGGRIDVKEFTTPLKDILLREIREELGDIEVELSDAPVAVGRHLISSESDKGNGHEIHLLYLFFEGRYKSGAIVTTADHAGFRWLNLSKHTLPNIFKSGLLEGVLMYAKKLRQH
jgi:8-oxo-dGTP pyrophosphatase MutT (NUDIX family)